MNLIPTVFVALLCVTKGTFLSRHLLQEGGQGGGGGNIFIKNCTSDCDLESCESDSDCSIYWEDNENRRYGDVVQFMDDYEMYCNDSDLNTTVDCSSGELSTFLLCLEDSTCWDCDYWSVLTLRMTIYDASGSVTTTEICNVEWAAYLDSLMGSDITRIQVNSNRCSGSGGGSGSGSGSGPSGSGGTGTEGSGRRLLQPPDGGESGGEGDGGEGGPSGQGSGCGEVTFNINVVYTESYEGTDYDPNDVLTSLASTVQSSALSDGLDVSVSLNCYDEECCDEECSALTADEDCETPTYECEASNSGAATIIVSGLIAYGTIIGALFAN